MHEIYRAMETAYKNGKLQAIGVSNFLEERYLDLINHCKVIPAINQVETHVFRQQAQLRKLECQIGTKHESWSPLACGQNGIWQTPALIEIARNHGKCKQLKNWKSDAVYLTGDNCMKRWWYLLPRSTFGRLPGH